MLNEFGMLQSVDVELDGVLHKGQFRVSGHSLIVYYAAEIKFVDYGLNRPETIATWMLSDPVRRARSTKKRPLHR